MKDLIKKLIKEHLEELPKEIDLTPELRQIRKIIKVKSNDSLKNGVENNMQSDKYEMLDDEQERCENMIKDKLTPILNLYLERGDYEGAKWFVGRSYQDVQTVGKVLLFRKILLHQKENKSL
jgi:hypothetical protein